MTDAAVELFSEEGYSAVSTRRVAERAGCSETLLFRYFGDKRGLLLAICNQLGGGLKEAGTHGDIAAFQDVEEFIESYLVERFAALKRDAPTLKVVIAALINDPEMTADFEKNHEEAVEYVADALRRFQDAGTIAAHVDIIPLARAIEQLSFAVGFLLQLVFGRPEKEIVAIAKSVALTLGQGLQADAPRPLLEPRRRKAVSAVLNAQQQLEKIVTLLEEDEEGGRRASRRRTS